MWCCAPVTPSNSSRVEPRHAKNGCNDMSLLWTAPAGGRYATRMPDRPVVHGECHPRFAAVREAFAANFRDRDEIGAAVAVVVDGATVVDLWGGHADLARTRPWERDTIVNVYSCTKGMTALCAHRLVSEGRLDLDAPVARYWPEFAAGGQGRRCRSAGCSDTARDSRRSGAFLPGEALYDWNAMCAALAAETPWWNAGHARTAITRSPSAGSSARSSAASRGRASARTSARRSPSRSGLDFHIGLPEAEHAPRRGDEPGCRCRRRRRPRASRGGHPVGSRGHRGARLHQPAVDGARREQRRVALGGDSRRQRPRRRPRAGARLRRARPRRRPGRRARPRRRRHRAAAARSSRTAPTWCCRSRRASVSASCCRRSATTPASARARAPSATPAREARSASPIRTPSVGFGYVMNRMGPHILLDPRAIGADRRGVRVARLSARGSRRGKPQPRARWDMRGRNAPPDKAAPGRTSTPGFLPAGGRPAVIASAARRSDGRYPGGRPRGPARAAVLDLAGWRPRGRGGT